MHCYKVISWIEATKEHVVLVKDVWNWMKAHHLQLNPGKTEILVFGTPSVLQDGHELSTKGVSISDQIWNLCTAVTSGQWSWISPWQSAQFQGPDQATIIILLLETERPCKIGKLPCNQANEHTRPSSYHLLLYTWTTATALVSDVVMTQLQNIQNRACRLVFGLKNRDFVQDKLKKLQWLKVRERIEFKLCLLALKLWMVSDHHTYVI